MKSFSRSLPLLSSVLAWVWAIVAGCGGLLLLIQRGPLPLTNGWFALSSGLAACPLTAWFYQKMFGRVLSWRLRLLAAAGLFIAGRIALALRYWPISLRLGP